MVVADREALVAKMRRWADALDAERAGLDLFRLGAQIQRHGIRPPEWIRSESFRASPVRMDRWMVERGQRRRGSNEPMLPFLARALRVCIAKLEAVR